MLQCVAAYCSVPAAAVRRTNLKLAPLCASLRAERHVSGPLEVVPLQVSYGWLAALKKKGEKPPVTGERTQNVFFVCSLYKSRAESVFEYIQTTIAAASHIHR